MVSTNPFKFATHIFAVIFGGAMAFVMTPAGQALIHQYPIVSGVVGVLSAVSAVYHTPKAAQ